jgi:hypothetical protein
MVVKLEAVQGLIQQSEKWRRVAASNERNSDFDAAASHSLMALSCALEALALLELGRVELPVAA